MKNRVTGCVSVLALALAVTLPVSAQDTADNSETEASNRRLTTVTVTAQRTEETLENAAIPVNAATGDELLQAGATDVTLLNKVAPSLSVTNGGGANTAFFVRGVGNFTNNGYTAPAIAFNIDGVYIGRPSSTLSSFLDLNRVEVLKGPQGTLYGRNSTGGAINIIPNTPELGETSGSLSVAAGNYSSYELTGVANIAVGENSAVRLAGSVSGRDGYYDDGTGDAEDLALRAQFFTVINEDLDVRIAADYSTQGGVGSGVNVEGVYTFAPFQGNLPVPNWPFIPSGLDAFTGLHDPTAQQFVTQNATAAPLFSPLDNFAYPSRDDTYWGVSAEINYDLGWADLVIIPAYRHSELDNQFNGPPFRAAINQDEAEQTSIEARLSGSVSAIDYILGAYYFDESVEGVNSFNQFSTVTYNDFQSDVESTAFFARATYNVTDEFRLVGGIRYTDEQRAYDTRAISAAAVCLIEPPPGVVPSCAHVPTLPTGLTAADSLSQLDPALFTGPPLPVLLDQIENNPSGVPAFTPYGPFGMFGPQAILAFTPTVIDRSASDEEVTYRVAAEYDVTPDNLLYASYETGFRAGGFNQSFGFEEYDPEYIDAFTIGSKNRFFDETLELNAELFFWEYEDQQLAALGLDARGDNSFYTRNVGSSSIQGLELDFQYAAAANTLIRGMVQVLDASYDEFSYTQVDLSDDTDPPNFLTPVTGCDFTQLGVDGDPATPREFAVDCSGQSALNAPDLTLTAGIQQIWELENFELIGNLDARYRSERQIGFSYVPGSQADAVTTADLSLTLLRRFIRLAPAMSPERTMSHRVPSVSASVSTSNILLRQEGLFMR